MEEKFESQGLTEPTELPENEYNELLNYWETTKNISNMLDSSNKTFTLEEYESIYDKIKDRIEKENLSSTDDFLNFLNSSIENNTKYLN